MLFGISTRLARRCSSRAVDSCLGLDKSPFCTSSGNSQPEVLALQSQSPLVAGLFMRCRMAGMLEVLLWMGLVITWPILCGVALGYAGLLQEKRQFSLRALLIITTILAICLAATVYAVKKVRQ